ncbi:hypothetical protein ACGK9R_01985 [Halomonas sp. HNIBRBA4712]|uniref:hypothetical protein n=1 Tax=Halomonas sp. HNIBRBA4712 TaxID=3373087 RepID=UPI0037474B38
MDTLTLALVFAIMAAWLSFSCGLVVVYLLLTGQEAISLGQKGRKNQDDEPSKPAKNAPVLVDDSGAAWGVQVLFNDPSAETDQRLISVLGALGGEYDSSAKAYALSGESSRTPVVVENAVSFAPLPAPDDAETSYNVKGVSVQIRAANNAMKPGKLQLAHLVKIAKALTRVGGTVVDAQKNPISKAGFKAVIAGEARM